MSGSVLCLAEAEPWIHRTSSGRVAGTPVLKVILSMARKLPCGTGGAKGSADARAEAVSGARGLLSATWLG
ncbi:hypothetical protein GCM10009664_04620 [Kitasatospora gansuensis]